MHVLHRDLEAIADARMYFKDYLNVLSESME